jgi:long-chain acyl-CoA synthetase
MEERVWHRSYDEGVPRDIVDSDFCVLHFLAEAAARYPDSAALFFLNSRLTYRELQRDVDRFAAALASLGVERGTRVAIHLPNIPPVVVATLATLSLGAVAVMTSPLFVARELEQQWGDAGCDVVVTADYLFAQRIREIRERLSVRHYVIASIPDALSFPVRQLARWKLKRQKPPLVADVKREPGVHRYRQLLCSAPARRPAGEIHPEDVALLQYTGGTTGEAKGAMLTHRNLVANVLQLASWFPGLDFGGEVCLGALPFFHIFGFTVAMVLPLHLGAANVLIPNPRDSRAVVRGITKHRVTLLPAVPGLFRAIAECPDIDKLDLSCIRRCFSGSAPLPVPLLERFEEMTGAVICEGFGLTEASPVTHVNPIRGTRKPGTIGLPLPSTEARVVDADVGERDVPPGQAGELTIHGPQVMLGYWDRPEATANTIRGGWLYTGDLAVEDEDGYFKIVGRKKDMVITSGFNVYPDEIDRVLVSHPAVREACSIGVPDPRRGEVVKSFVVREPGMEISVSELVAYCRKNLAAYKVPRSFEFRDALPMSTIMKTLRRVLREEEQAANGGGQR